MSFFILGFQVANTTQVTITSTTISDNTVDGSGAAYSSNGNGGAFALSGPINLRLVGSTITGNEAKGSTQGNNMGGAFYQFGKDEATNITIRCRSPPLSPFPLIPTPSPYFALKTSVLGGTNSICCLEDFLEEFAE